MALLSWRYSPRVTLLLPQLEGAEHHVEAATEYISPHLSSLRLAPVVLEHLAWVEHGGWSHSGWSHGVWSHGSRATVSGAMVSGAIVSIEGTSAP